MRAYVQVEPINATSSQGVWTRSHECGAYGNIRKHFVWFYFFSNYFRNFNQTTVLKTETRWPAMRRPHLVLSFHEASLVLWNIIPEKVSPLWCCGELYLKKCHLFGAAEYYTWNFLTSLVPWNIIPEKLSPLWCCVEHYTRKIVTQAIIIRCCRRWTRGGC